MELNSTFNDETEGSGFSEMPSAVPSPTSILTPVQRGILSGIMIFISISGCVGNIVVICAVALSKKLRCITNVFVVNLAVADLMTCLNIPWMVVAILSVDGWPLPDWICSSCGFTLIVCIGSSIYTLACIATIRYVVITGTPGRCQTIYTTPKLCTIITLIWTVPLLLAFVPIVFDLGKLGYDFKYSSCTWDTGHHNSENLSKILAATYYPLPFIVITYSYLKILFHVRRHSRTVGVLLTVSSTVRPVGAITASAAAGSLPGNPPSARQISSQSHNPRENNPPREHNNVRAKINRRQVEVTKNMFYIVCVFLLCISPFGFSLFYEKSDPVIPYAGMLIFCNSCINPFVYATKHPVFKKVIWLILKCKFSKIS